VVAGTIRRFHDRLIVPQLGWNRVRPEPDSRLLEDGYAYYANSYRLEALPEGYTGALTDHGEPFIAAVERGAQLACQFHPELSGPWGQALLTRWLGAR
jgi:glutamine amidotransferase